MVLMFAHLLLAVLIELKNNTHMEENRIEKVSRVTFPQWHTDAQTKKCHF